ncbi:hypothetical protein [Ezakiella sp.]|uniref:hypothetical protein n=1 Tax=Ezakiella sp. TaxID=1935205 RepID=UPI002A91E649|nr:hypothetical protein [Ezakiella sp.]
MVDRRWNFERNFIVCMYYADMAKLADAHGSADDFNQSQLLLPSNRSWEISCS